VYLILEIFNYLNFRCDDLSVGPYGSPVESCTQHQEQICNQVLFLFALFYLTNF